MGDGGFDMGEVRPDDPRAKVELERGAQGKLKKRLVTTDAATPEIISAAIKQHVAGFAELERECKDQLEGGD